MASIREVARLAKVAPSTVSRALNDSGYVAEETREKIKAAVAELDYVPNQWIRNLYRQSTGIIGVIAPGLIHPFFSSLWNHLELELRKFGYNMMLCSTGGEIQREREYLDTLERNLFDGVIVGTASLPDESYTKLKKPIVFLDRIIPGIPVVSSNHQQGGELAARKLIESGCRKVLYTRGDRTYRLPSHEGNDAFDHYLREHGVQTITKEISWEDTTDFARCFKITKSLLAKNMDIDGILASDLQASAFLKAAKSLGISVPDKLKIIAYDGTFVTDFNSTSLTAIVQDVHQLAKQTVSVLLKLINDKPLNEERIQIGVTLQQGETTP
ncbi:LacI family DNA-binding transcriptional regulator [Paenibacillus physcomitrellae]|uniref:LacI family transcriptional regulator n=1 Tax=Paenibacillus physcomitrellae TaxID=1619311 RepID=A0ABQ1GRZ5_9BACL|nr:LacI family DNA-binding transcriptional regulator [Paenibacillus physcomitrellae]GGA48920.1 LacI family transcriptional regulator [Paenibacillus physcomitrellae]